MLWLHRVPLQKAYRKHELACTRYEIAPSSRPLVEGLTLSITSKQSAPVDWPNRTILGYIQRFLSHRTHMHTRLPLWARRVVPMIGDGKKHVWKGFEFRVRLVYEQHTYIHTYGERCSHAVRGPYFMAFPVVRFCCAPAQSL